MLEIHPRYVLDETSERTEVLLPITEWLAIVEALEELDDISAYDAAKECAEAAVPFE